MNSSQFFKYKIVEYLGCYSTGATRNYCRKVVDEWDSRKIYFTHVENGIMVACEMILKSEKGAEKPNRWNPPAISKSVKWNHTTEKWKYVTGKCFVGSEPRFARNLRLIWGRKTLFPYANLLTVHSPFMLIIAKNKVRKQNLWKTIIIHENLQIFPIFSHKSLT